jgi:carbon monoxide dehydrogenase subunit G
MQIANDFPISLPPDEAYRLLLDLERVAPCMPGAELGDALEDGSRAVKVKVKLGPMRFTYEGAVRVAEQDESARRALLVGTAKEARGQGTAEARITMTVADAADGSTVSTSADVDLTGRAAQMGHGVVAAVSAQLLRQMSANLEASIAAGDPPAPAPVLAPAPTAPAPPRSAPASPPRPAAAPSNDLRAGKLVLAVLRGWVARLTRRDRKGTTR